MFKLLSKTISVVIILALFTSLISCEEEPEPGPNLYDSIAALSNTSTFLEMVDLSGFADDFRTGQAITVFVPTNLAFDNYLRRNNIPSLNDIPVEDLRNLLRYHILPFSINLPALGNSYYLTASGASPSEDLLAILIQNPGARAVLNQKVTVINQDLQVDGGFFNTVDQVLELPTLHSVMDGNEAFEEFFKGITNVDGLEDSLMNNGPYTLFLTTDANVNSVISSRYGVSDILDLEEAVLDSLMKFHIVKGNQRTADIQTATSFDYETLLPGKTMRLSGETNITVNRQARMAISDIQTTNGVVHILDTFLDYQE